MDWVTVYDIRDHAGGTMGGQLFVPLIGMALLVVIPVIALWRRGLKFRLAFLLASAPVCGLVIALDYRLATSIRHDAEAFAEGRFLETAGVVRGAHWVTRGKSGAWWFNVDNQWFASPFSAPRDCLPRDGERVRFAFDSQPFSAHTAYHEIYRLQLGRGCGA